MYKVVIGLEVHCELKTKSKNFSYATNDYSETPNIYLDTVDLGFPGILPVANKEAVKSALKIAMALNCENPDEVIFDRKNYFYPDLPKGYQITQSHKPMGINGYLMVNVDDEDIKVDIHDLHLEEDTASLDHFNEYSLINYNRSGIPLIEIVTEPCLHSSKEAIAFLEALRSVILYCGVSDARSDLGQMRCDVNISLMKEDATEFGTKVEIKNINSFTKVKEAIEYEIERQTEVLNSGGTIIMETRRFDDEDMKTYSMRSKVDAVDYKYFLEPNMPPIKLTKEFLDEIRSQIPMLQYERINLYINEYGLSRYDATTLVKEKKMADYFEETIKDGTDAKLASNWITSIVLGHLNKFQVEIDQIYLTPAMLVSLIKMVNDGKISSKQAKEVLYKVLEEEKDPVTIVDELGIKQIENDEEIRSMVVEILDANLPLIEEYRKGRNVFDFFVGQVMKRTKGQANPTLTAKIIKEEIEKR
ncbi:MAG: Asp-tRNA(Asn)/Glu-tRNA(Gln) amidotransferase subunit GatB [Bacilli bacterium]|nr:Asp-tRNA(Asn)/Glu-tRNA(Gln) amidotransferase subunit GatB [Bacilli bacterium]MDD4808611.1 Asp-tRNA(Asn)/Glu-tRNA(Gln) amidotransferase subunit GatB [Bacilli bacterium]